MMHADMAFSSSSSQRPQHSKDPPPNVAGLLANREKLAEFVMDHEHTIRAVARRKLTRGTRAVFDSEDVMATVLRRVDQLAQSGEIRAADEGEMLSLIFRIAENAACSKSRIIELAKSRQHEELAFSQLLLKNLANCAGDEEAGHLVARMFASLESAEDRTVFLLRLRGIEHRVIAQMLNITPEACRQRWKKIRDELVERFAGPN